MRCGNKTSTVSEFIWPALHGDLGTYVMADRVLQLHASGRRKDGCGLMRIDCLSGGRTAWRSVGRHGVVSGLTRVPSIADNA